MELYYEESVERCVEYEPLRSLYYVIVCISLFFLPVFIMITAYSLILWRLSRAEVPGEHHAANVNVHSRARRKVIFKICIKFEMQIFPCSLHVLFKTSIILLYTIFYPICCFIFNFCVCILKTYKCELLNFFAEISFFERNYCIKILMLFIF